MAFAFSFCSSARISARYSSLSTRRFALPNLSSSSSRLLSSGIPSSPSASEQDASLASSSSRFISATMLLTSDMLYCIICRRRAASSGDSFAGMTGCRWSAAFSGDPSTTGMTGSTCFTVGILVLLLCSSKLSVLVSAVKLTLFLGFRGFPPLLDLAAEELDPSTLVAFGLVVPDESDLALLSERACWAFSGV